MPIGTHTQSEGQDGQEKATVEGLIEFLQENGVDTSAWGTGAAKTVRDLLEEIQEGESQLLVSEEGLCRVTAVAFIDVQHVNPYGRIFRLVEEKQVFKDGRERMRNLPKSLGEKIKAREDPADVAVRGVHEELGIKIVRGREVALGQEFSRRDSASYPGLVTRYDKYNFQVKLTEAEFNPAGYKEDDGKKITTFIWQEVVE